MWFPIYWHLENMGVAVALRLVQLTAYLKIRIQCQPLARKNLDAQVTLIIIQKKDQTYYPTDLFEVSIKDINQYVK